MLARLLRAVRRESILPAFILAGPEGVGKKLLALLAAQVLNCEKPEPDGACGQCAPCRKIARGIHPDVHVIVPEGSEIKIKQTRELSADLQYRPFEGKRKVYILDPAERLNEAATNSILKTLEECPAYAWIVLVTAHPNALLPTIRSRCPVYRLAPIPAADIESFLVQGGRDPQQARVLSKACGGSIGRAISQDWSQLQMHRSRAVSLLQRLAPGGFYQVRNFWSKLSTEERTRLTLEDLFQTLLVLLRDLLMLKENRRPEVTHDDIAPQLASLASAYSFERICELEAQLRNALRELQRNVNAQVLVESLYFEQQ
ncbi:MAG: DNA polymerase III subunit delta' [Acidobacteria bacterium]|nr:DNA polymerase III subunit delta' [Acidobacteriota bacterium]